MLGWKPKHEPGKHVRQGEPVAGKGGKRPKLLDVIVRWPNGGIQERQTRAMRRGK